MQYVPLLGCTKACDLTPLLSVDVVADALLVALVLLLLRDARQLKKSQRKLIFAMFSATVLTTVVSIVHVVFVIGPESRLEGITASIEVCYHPVCYDSWYSPPCQSVRGVTDRLQSPGGRPFLLPSISTRRSSGTGVIRLCGSLCLWPTTRSPGSCGLF